MKKFAEGLIQADVVCAIGLAARIILEVEGARGYGGQCTDEAWDVDNGPQGSAKTRWSLVCADKADITGPGRRRSNEGCEERSEECTTPELFVLQGVWPRSRS